ncbi:hypothetical protein F5B20DRAFT_592692 [Whalleya microplaca]|nr:hypothetical protein F5B20DRAFT_592692 [Whalleya microplaca]
MKVSFTSVLYFLGAVNALPAFEIDARQVSNKPITLKNGPDPNDNLQCGDNEYSGRDIYLAAQYGINLALVGETRGRNKYPHTFDHDSSKGNTLKFPKECPENDDARKEYPLQVNGRYDGGKNNVKQGDERVVYFHKDDETDIEGHALVYYCGIMTHVGAPAGGFKLC